MILSNKSEQHLYYVGVRRRIGLKIVETLSVYFAKNVISCEYMYSSHARSQTVLNGFINLLRVKLSFTLERAASNEYPLQTFSLLVSIGLDLARVVLRERFNVALTLCNDYA